MKLNFEPTGKLAPKKQYHYICIGLAIIIPVALIIFTLIKGNFSVTTLIICAIIAVIMLGIDYSNRSNMVVWNNEQIALLKMFGNAVYYRWDNLSAAQNSESTLRLDFTDGKSCISTWNMTA